MKVKRVNTYAKVGMFFIKGQINDAGVIREVISRPLSQKDLKEFLLKRNDISNMRRAPTTNHYNNSTREQAFGKLLSWVFNGNWPHWGYDTGCWIYQVTEQGITEVEVTL